MKQIKRSLWRGCDLLLLMQAIALAAAVAFGVVVHAAAARAQGESKPDTGANQSSPDIDQLKHLIATYAKSVDGADTALASQIWSHSSDVTFIHPRGWEHGFNEVKKNVYERAMGETFSARKLTIHDVAVHVYGEVAWAEFYWQFEAKVRKDGSAITTQGRETQIYRKEGGEWRIVHVHYSGMPVTGERQGF